MGVAAGSLHGGLAAKPQMNLQFTVQAHRQTKSRTVIGSTSSHYTKYGSPLPCDLIVLTDNLLLLQPGDTEQIVAVATFYENADVQKGDIIQVLSHRRLGGATVGSYFYVKTVLQPSEDYGYVDAHLTFGQEPTKVVA